MGGFGRFFVGFGGFLVGFEEGGRFGRFLVGFERFLVGFEEGGRRRTFREVEEGRFGRSWKVLVCFDEDGRFW